MAITPLLLATWYGAQRLAQAATPPHRPIVDAELLAAVLAAGDTSGWSSEQIADALGAIANAQSACDAAKAEANSYVLLRASSVPAPAPDVLNVWEGRIAWYRLHPDLRISAEGTADGRHPIHRDYDDAIKSLRDYRDGKQGLGIPQDANVPPATAEVEWQSKPTQWTRSL
ncbi:DUF1320 family protein [bacterium]|nr:DUF1320 family protein [bacterium]